MLERQYPRREIELGPLFAGAGVQALESWALEDLNLRPLPCQGSALPLS